jgi:hypothetical protein
VAYRAGCEPPHPPDWSPWEFTEEELQAATHVLVTWPDPDDEPEPLAGAARLSARGLVEEACVGRNCLYATGSPSSTSCDACSSMSARTSAGSAGAPR